MNTRERLTMKSYKFKSENFELEVRKENNTIQIWNDEFGLLKLYFNVKGITSETISMNAEREFIFVPRTKELSMDEFSKLLLHIKILQIKLRTLISVIRRGNFKC